MGPYHANISIYQLHGGSSEFEAAIYRCVSKLLRYSHTIFMHLHSLTDKSSNAFARWTQYLPMTINAVSSTTTKSDIYIRFKSFGPSEPAYAFTNMIADGTSLTSGLINITFNDDWDWTDDRLFNFTATHEIGHALGLSHSKVEDAVMWPYYDAQLGPVHPDDIAAVHAIYGWKSPSWNRIDSNSGTKGIAQVSSTDGTVSPMDGIYQLRSTGQILWYNAAGTWVNADNNKDTAQITGSNGVLYQRHTDGSIYRLTALGTAWQNIQGISDGTIDIVAAADQIYQRRKDGWIARWSGSSTSWTSIAQPSVSVSRQIAVTDQKTLWNLLSSGDVVRSEWPYGEGWQIVDDNPDNIAIAVGGEQFYKLESSGLVVWLDLEEYLWKIIENKQGSVAIFASGVFLYSRHKDGSLWRYTGTPEIWELIDNGRTATNLQVNRKGIVWQLLGNGEVWKMIS